MTPEKLKEVIKEVILRYALGFQSTAHAKTDELIDATKKYVVEDLRRVVLNENAVQWVIGPDPFGENKKVSGYFYMIPGDYINSLVNTLFEKVNQLIGGEI